MEKIRIHNKESGIALITSLIVLMAITIVSGAVIFQATTQYRISRRNKAEIVAMNLAEAGVEYAIWKLETDSTFSGTGPVTVGEGDFTCVVSNIAGFTNERLITVSGSATGYPVERTVMVRVGLAYTGSSDWQGNSPFGYAAFGKDKVTNMNFTGSVEVDAYNSDSGTYAATNCDSGDIRCNAGIDISGSVEIKGDAIPGPYGSVTTTGSSSVTGSTTSADTYAALIDIPNTETSKCTQALSLSGSTNLTLGTAGTTTTYYYTSVSLSGSSKITIPNNATVILYVSGNVDLSGGGLVNSNPQNDATTFIIYAAGSSVKLTGSSDFTGVCYAPNATINLSGSTDFYGSFIGNKVKVTGSVDVHYDLAAQNMNVSWWETASGGTPGGVQTIVSWQRR